MVDVFCEFFASESKEILGETERFYIVVEPKPVSPGHCLIVSKEHRLDAFTLTQGEWANFAEAIDEAKKLTERLHPDGYNIGMNCGASAGQSQFHFHAHFIPRYEGDVEDSTGGERNIMEIKMSPKL